MTRALAVVLLVHAGMLFAAGLLTGLGRPEALLALAVLVPSMWLVSDAVYQVGRRHGLAACRAVVDGHGSKP